MTDDDVLVKAEEEEEEESKQISKQVNKQTEATTFIDSHTHDAKETHSYRERVGLHQEFKRFCGNLEQDIQVCHDIALQDFMLKYRHLLPEIAAFSLIENPELRDLKNRCSFANCKRQAVGKVIYLEKNTEFRACVEHLKQCKDENGRIINPKNRLWKVLEHANE